MEPFRLSLVRAIEQNGANAIVKYGANALAQHHNGIAFYQIEIDGNAQAWAHRGVHQTLGIDDQVINKPMPMLPTGNNTSKYVCPRTDGSAMND